MFKDQTPILLTRQIHDAKRAGLHYDIRLVLGDKAYSWATRRDMPKLGETINIYEQPVHDSSYALRKYIYIPPGNYGAGTTTLDFVRKAVAHNKENFKGKFTLTVPSIGERYLFRKVPSYGENTWILKNLPPKVETETTEKIEKLATIMPNKYLTKIASDLAKAEQYEKSEKKEVRMYSKEEKEADCPDLKEKLREIIPQEKEHAKKFESVVKAEEKEKQASMAYEDPSPAVAVALTGGIPIGGGLILIPKSRFKNGIPKAAVVSKDSVMMLIPDVLSHFSKEAFTSLTKKASINIKPSHKGLLHKKLGLKPNSPISESTLESAGKDATGKLKKEIVFAENARKWHHS